MIKKARLIFLIAIIAFSLMGIAFASVSVTLNPPTVNGRNATLSCDVNVADPADTLQNIELYSNTTGAWHSNQTNASCSGQVSCTASFIVYNIPNGSYIWNCKAYNATGSFNFSETNGTFTVSVAEGTANSPPQLDIDIPKISWYKNESATIDLSDHFSDADGDTLMFNATSPANITVEIDNSIVTFTSDINWTGTRTVVFTANDSLAATESNTVTLEVIEPPDTEEETVNNPPSITSTAPAGSLVSVQGSQLFSINKTDTDNDALTVTWYLDGEQVRIGTDSYTLSDLDSGTYELSASVSDGINTTSWNWTIIYETAGAPSEPEQDLDEEPSGPECGNNICDTGEDCNNCEEDCGCRQGEVCTSEGDCEKESNTLLYIVIGFLVMAVIAFLATRIIRRKGEAKPEEPALMPKGVPPKMPPPSGIPNMPPEKPVAMPPEKPAAAAKPEEEKEELKPAMPPGEPVAEPAMPPEKPAEPPETVFGKEKPKPLFEARASPVQEYIRQMREKGFSDEDIRKKLRKQGWQDYRIAMEFLTMKGKKK